jgi:hypothetical protein
MDMMTFLATEGGRRCPLCGRFSKPEQFGWVGISSPTCVVDVYGHLGGCGAALAKAAGEGGGR